MYELQLESTLLGLTRAFDEQHRDFSIFPYKTVINTFLLTLFFGLESDQCFSDFSQKLRVNQVCQVYESLLLG